MSRFSLLFNPASQRAQAGVRVATQGLEKTFQRLSSGSRINSPSDDPAGLAVALKLSSSSRVLAQSSRNIGDGVSLLAVADGATNELSSILSRLSELANQSATGTLSAPQRKALDTEGQALSDEYNRIARSTTFNGRSLFNSDFGSLAIAASGSGDRASSIQSGLGGGIGDGTFRAAVAYAQPNATHRAVALDMNRDAILDLVSISSGESIQVNIGNGDGTFRAGYTAGMSGSDPNDLRVGDFNGDGVGDLVTADAASNTLSVLLGRGDGTFQTRRSLAVGVYPTNVRIADLNGDGKSDLISGDEGGSTLGFFLGNGDGTFRARVTIAAGAGTADVDTGDFDGDGKIDIVGANYNDNTLRFLRGNGDGTFQSSISYALGGQGAFMLADDVNKDGLSDVIVSTFGNGTQVFLGRSSGLSFASNVTTAGPNGIAAADVNGDGALDLVGGDWPANSLTVNFGNGDGSFKSATTYATGTGPYGVLLKDLNNDGAVDIISSGVTSSSMSILLGNRQDGIAPIEKFSLRSSFESLQAIDQFRRVSDRLSLQRSTIGSFQSRLQVAGRVTSERTQAYQEAFSRISDADVATEVASMVQFQILQQASTALLAQANQQPALVARLLGGT